MYDNVVRNESYLINIVLELLLDGILFICFRCFVVSKMFFLMLY